MWMLLNVLLQKKFCRDISGNGNIVLTLHFLLDCYDRLRHKIVILFQENVRTRRGPVKLNDFYAVWLKCMML